MANFINGGFLAGYRTYIMSGAGIISAVCAYLAGDIDIFGAMQTVFAFSGIYFLRKAGRNKRKKNGKNSGKIHE